MKKFSWLLFGFILGLNPNLLWPQNTSNLKLLAHVNPAPGTTYSEVTGCGDLAIIGAFQGNSFVWIYDLTDKTNPALLSAIPIQQACLDVQVHGRYLFISFRNGMAWYDILDPRQPKLVKDFRPSPSINAHTSFVSGNTLYIADQVSGGVRIFDVTDKSNPQPLANLQDPGWTIHDMTVIRGRMYAAWIFGQPSGQLMLADVANPSQPRVLAKVRYPQAGTHNAWPTEDGQYIFSTDEVNGTRHNLKVWDARTSGQLTQVTEYTPPTVAANSTIHNVYVRGRYAYMSYYCEGVHIYDIADPRQPREVARYDFNGTEPCISYFSNWGVDPFSDLIYASDMEQGLFVLEFDDHPAANLAGKVIDASTGAPVSGAMVYFLDEYPTSRTDAAGEFGIPWFRNDTVRLVTEAADYHPDTTTATTRTAEKTSLTIRLRRLSTGVESAVEAPKNFALLPTYPNPFSSAGVASALQIAFRLPQPERVQLEIFNTFGQRVRALLRAPRAAGTHAIAWDGTDDGGLLLPAGIYFARLHAGKFSAARKITLMR